MADSNLLTYEEFKSVMDDIKRAYEYSHKWNDFMYENISGRPNIFQPDCVETSIFLLEKIFNDSAHMITFFCNGLQFGAACGEYPHLRTVSDLYDLLMENIARLSVGAVQIEPGGDA